jgi:hypothetical protein
MTIPLVISERRQTYLENCSGEKLAEFQQQSFDHESWRKNDIRRVAVLITQRRGNRAAVIVVRKQVTAQQRRDVPGYVHTQYAFIDQICGGAQLVDHYGSPVNPNDKEVKLVEQRACMELAMNTRDGD